MSTPTQSRLRGHLGEAGWTRARAIASLGMVFGLGAVGTMAAWSDTATATTGMFSTSSVSIQIQLDGNRPSHAFTSLNKINLARGGSTASMLPVQNTGSADFTYTMKATVADSGTATYGSASAATLASNLTVAVYSGATASASQCSGGTVIALKPLSLGNVDFWTAGRPVAESSAEDLCFQATVNSAAPLAARMAALSVKFNFEATQA